MKTEIVRTALEAGGILAITIGVGLVSLPAACIVGGLGLIAAAHYDRGDG